MGISVEEFLFNVSLLREARDARVIGRRTLAVYLLHHARRLPRMLHARLTEDVEPGHWGTTYIRERDAINLQKIIAVASLADGDILRDKARFERHLTAHELPAVPSLGQLVGDQRAGLEPIRDRVEALPSLIVKPTCGVCGVGVERYDRDERGLWRRQGDSLDVGDTEQLLSQLMARARTEDILLQECQQNHPWISRISPRAAATLRVVTYVSASGTLRPLAIAHRFPVGDAVADNHHSGGLAAAVDESSGRLGSAYCINGSVHAIHPSTGEPIEGQTVPFLEESVELALRAHATLRDFFSVGWDILITPQGPLLLEGNHIWGSDIVQMPSGQNLLAMEWTESLLKRLVTSLQGSAGRAERRVARQAAWYLETTFGTGRRSRQVT